jgi:hypothetical protein
MRFAVCLVLVLMSGCGRGERAPSGEPLGDATRAADLGLAQLPQIELPEVSTLAHVDAPPHGRWRLAAPDKLEHVVLWLSHILIRNEEVSDQNLVPFNYAGWRFVAPASPRSRADAERLALGLQEQAQQHPEQFAALARQFSDDAVTKSAGGALGGMKAFDFAGWPQVLDALAQTPIGGVSGVVETEHGFHIFFRHPRPPEEQLSGQRIVVAHDEAPWIEVAARDAVPRRSRAEALASATDIYAYARQHPEFFERLVNDYSDHEDAARGGDFGTWSSGEGSPFPRELDTLSKLLPQQVAPPMDTVFGYQIIKRVENRARAEYAMARLQLTFDPEAAGEAEGSRASTLARANTLLAAVVEKPSRFAELQTQYCCTALTRVVEGRYSPAVEAVLSRLRPGDVAPEVIAYGPSTFLIIQRVELSALPQRETLEYDLPAPEAPDMSYFVSSRSGEFIEAGLRALGQKAAAALQLSPVSAAQLVRAHEQSGRFSDPGVNKRLAQLKQLDERVRRLLGAAAYARYRGLAQQHFEALMFGSGLWADVPRAASKDTAVAAREGAPATSEARTPNN